jgi:hypothetical protein
MLHSCRKSGEITSVKSSRGGFNAQGCTGNVRLDRDGSCRIGCIQCGPDERERPSQADHSPPHRRTSKQRYHQLLVIIGVTRRCQSSTEEPVDAGLKYSSDGASFPSKDSSRSRRLSFQGSGSRFILRTIEIWHQIRRHAVMRMIVTNPIPLDLPGRRKIALRVDY